MEISLPVVCVDAWQHKGCSQCLRRTRTLYGSVCCSFEGVSEVMICLRTTEVEMRMKICRTGWVDSSAGRGAQGRRREEFPHGNIVQRPLRAVTLLQRRSTSRWYAGTV